jgi:hypothetical protein
LSGFETFHENTGKTGDIIMFTAIICGMFLVTASFIALSVGAFVSVAYQPIPVKSISELPSIE